MGLCASGLKVWVVDDSSLEAEQACRALSTEFDCEVFLEGSPVLERLAAGERPDVLLLDWVMPGMSGVELCRFIRTTNDDVSLPILLFTSHRESTDVVEGLSAGANDYVRKPYVPAELLARAKTLARAKAAQAQAETERRTLHDVFTQSPVAIAVQEGPGHTYTFANPAYCRLLGVRDVTGKTLFEALPELRGQGFDALLDKVVATGEVVVGQEAPVKLAHHGEGEWLYVNFSYQPKRDAAGVIDGVLTSAVDVTEQVLARRRAEIAAEALRQSEERLRRVVEASGAGLWDLDAATGAIEADRRMVELMGLPEGSTFSLASGLDTLPADDRERVAAAVAAALAGENGGRYLTEFRTCGRGDAPLRWVESRAQVLFDERGKAVRLAGAMIDVTHRKLAELERASILEALAAQPMLRVCVLQGPELVYQMANAIHLQHVALGRDVVGKRLLDVLPELKGRGFDERLRRAMATGVPYVGHEVEVPLDRNGALEKRYFSFVYQPVRGASGAFDSVLSVAHEVTETVRSRQALQAAYDVLEHGEPTFSLDADFRFTFVNAAWLTWTDSRREDVVGRSVWDALPASDDARRQDAEAYRRAMREREPVHFTQYYAPKKLWAAVSLYPTANGGVAGFVRDVTAQKQAEAELQGRADFERQLIGIVSHDLRTPLGAILMGTHLLTHWEGLDEKALKVLLRIESSAERGARMVKDLLDFTQARLGGGIPVTLAPGNLHAAVRQVVDEVSTLSPDREVQLSASGDGHGTWDIARLSQAVLNLVSNALKYSPPSSVVTVRSEADNDGVTVSVHNDGPPIAEGDRARIFQPMHRATSELENTARSVGLGLFIVKHLVDAHGGTIAVTSKPELGTTFAFRVPKRARAEGSLAQRRARPGRHHLGPDERGPARHRGPIRPFEALRTLAAEPPHALVERGAFTDLDSSAG